MRVRIFIISFTTIISSSSLFLHVAALLAYINYDTATKMHFKQNVPSKPTPSFK